MSCNTEEYERSPIALVTYCRLVAQKLLRTGWSEMLVANCIEDFENLHTIGSKFPICTSLAPSLHLSFSRNHSPPLDIG
ncbi:unnamed protein product [Clonostachys rosea f. rosea IK726]|uniref:Uncharacterized protein n=1 Tax=Clonostachys rosea f. rosea IK726 TaxID=1349383 RepID=A0ACA9U014_BIOOC|nr:unnamed protein product [Clonostachys rosea f. rosea IK726]